MDGKDYHVPDMTGADVARALGGDAAPTTMVALTGQDAFRVLSDISRTILMSRRCLVILYCAGTAGEFEQMQCWAAGISQIVLKVCCASASKFSNDPRTMQRFAGLCRCLFASGESVLTIASD